MNYTFETVNCNLCNSNEYEEISNKGKFGLPIHVVLCKNCGLGYLNPRWDRGSYLHFYQHEYDKYYRPKGSTNANIAINELNLIAERLSRLNLLPTEAEKILDIGSGEGENLMHFDTLFPNSNLYAIEPSIESKKSLEAYGVTVIGDDVDTDWHLGYESAFDFIILRHVLEHFLDPLEVLKKVRSVLRDSGIIYLAVPNNLKPTQNLEKSWFRNVHTYYFNKFTLTKLFEKAGFKILGLVDEDELCKGEMFVIAQRGELKMPTFKNEHFELQKDVFESKLSKEKTMGYKLNAIQQKIKRFLSKI